MPLCSPQWQSRVLDEPGVLNSGRNMVLAVPALVDTGLVLDIILLRALHRTPRPGRLAVLVILLACGWATSLRQLHCLYACTFIGFIPLQNPGLSSPRFALQCMWPCVSDEIHLAGLSPCVTGVALQGVLHGQGGKSSWCSHWVRDKYPGMLE